MNMSRSIRITKNRQSKLYTLIAIVDVVVLAASFGVIIANW